MQNAEEGGLRGKKREKSSRKIMDLFPFALLSGFPRRPSGAMNSVMALVNALPTRAIAMITIPKNSDANGNGPNSQRIPHRRSQRRTSAPLPSGFPSIHRVIHRHLAFRQRRRRRKRDSSRPCSESSSSSSSSSDVPLLLDPE